MRDLTPRLIMYHDRLHALIKIRKNTLIQDVLRLQGVFSYDRIIRSVLIKS